MPAGGADVDHTSAVHKALETPMSRQLDALRNLTQVKLPVFSENFEGLKPEYASPGLAQIQIILLSLFPF